MPSAAQGRYAGLPYGRWRAEGGRPAGHAEWTTSYPDPFTPLGQITAATFGAGYLLDSIHHMDSKDNTPAALRSKWPATRWVVLHVWQADDDTWWAEVAPGIL